MQLELAQNGKVHVFRQYGDDLNMKRSMFACGQICITKKVTVLVKLPAGDGISKQAAGQRKAGVAGYLYCDRCRELAKYAVIGSLLYVEQCYGRGIL